MSFRLFDFAVDPITLECGVRLPALPIRGWVGSTGRLARVGATGRCGCVHTAFPHCKNARTHRCVTRHPNAAARCGLSYGIDCSCPHGRCARGRVGWMVGLLVGPWSSSRPEQNADFLCFNNLGSCYGTYGPDDAGFPHEGGCGGHPDRCRDKGGLCLARTPDARPHHHLG